MIENGQYFTINRARQHGKTTTLRALADYLKTDYTVISLDFQRMSSLDFENESAFVNALETKAALRTNSPWNIAASFRVDMGFSSGEIAGMLEEYEQDHLTGMDIQELAEAIYNRTSGYPYLVSGLCKYLDEEICGTADFPDRKQAWTKDGVIEAEKLLTTENNPLFQSLTGKLTDYPQLRSAIYELLFTGKPIPYVPQNPYIDVAAMLGFIRNDNGTAVISNRIFESVLYNLFISEEFSESIPRRTIHHRAKGVER